jgi:hypothetical protein
VAGGTPLSAIVDMEIAKVGRRAGTGLVKPSTLLRERQAEAPKIAAEKESFIVFTTVGIDNEEGSR